MNKHGNIVIYKDMNGNDNIEVKLEDNTVWLNQEQLVKLYNSSKSNIFKHIKHVFEEMICQLFGNSEQLHQTVNYIIWII